MAYQFLLTLRLSYFKMKRTKRGRTKKRISEIRQNRPGYRKKARLFRDKVKHFRGSKIKLKQWEKC